jgi:hypothetical protein
VRFGFDDVKAELSEHDLVEDLSTCTISFTEAIVGLGQGIIEVYLNFPDLLVSLRQNVPRILSKSAIKLFNNVSLLEICVFRVLKQFN